MQAQWAFCPSRACVSWRPKALLADGSLEAVLVVSPDRARRIELGDVVDAGGWVATTVSSGQEALWELAPALPHLVVVDVPDPTDAEWALELIDRIRGHSGGDRTPIVLLMPREHRPLTLAAFARRADDVVAGPTYADELIARFKVRLERRPVPRDDLKTDPISGALSEASFAAQVEHELDRLERGGRSGVLALLQLDELPELEARYGVRAREEIMAQLVALIEEDSRDIDFVGHARGVLAILMPATPAKGGQVRLDRLTRLLAGRSMMVSGTIVRITPIIGYAESERGLTVEELEDRAWVAMTTQAEQLDLHPTRWTPAMDGRPSKGRTIRALGRYGTPLQILVQQLACLALPLGVYFALDRNGLDITQVVYYTLVVSLALTAAAIWLEGFAALRRPDLPEEPAELPAATAVIAAYLPNEADTIVETVEAFLAQDYPGPADRARLQHPAPAARRGRAAGDRAQRIPGWSRSASRARPPRRRTSTPRSRSPGRVRRHLRRRPPPGPGLLRARLALARRAAPTSSRATA